VGGLRGRSCGTGINCLAARERGLGTCLTAIHLAYEREAAEILGIPYDEIMQVALREALAGQGRAAAGRRASWSALIRREIQLLEGAFAGVHCPQPILTLHPGAHGFAGARRAGWLTWAGWLGWLGWARSPRGRRRPARAAADEVEGAWPLLCAVAPCHHIGRLPGPPPYFPGPATASRLSRLSRSLGVRCGRP
jgi:hypothetical protein